MKKEQVIGLIGFGRFGVLTAAILAPHFTVKVYKHKDTSEIKRNASQLGVSLVDFEEVSQCDIVVLATPMSKTEEMIKKVAPLMKSGALLLDTCSVKALPCAWLEKYAPQNIEIMGTHPMFGPVTSKFDLKKKSWQLANLQIVLCPLRLSQKRLSAVKKFLRTLRLEVIETTPIDHDRQNAKTLSLVHFIGRTLKATGISEQQIFTPGYTDLLRILPHTTSDNWQLFFDMNNLNHYADEVREHFLAAAFGLEEKIIKSRSTDDFAFNRSMIDRIDGQIFKLLKQRLAFAAEIGRIKKDRGLAITDIKREEEIIKKRTDSSEFDEEFVSAFYKLIFKESKKKQNI